MKTVSFKVPDRVLKRARRAAGIHQTSLQAAFRAWLEEYGSSAGRVKDVDALMRRLRHVRSGGPFTRDETNER